MSRILLSTIYGKSDSTLLSIKKFNIDKVFLLVDKDLKSEQLESINIIKKISTDVKQKKIDVYDMKLIAAEIVKIIDSETASDDEIYVDISQGRKPQAFGLLFACYSRNNKIKRIVYWSEDKKLIEFPRLSLELDNETKFVLKNIENNGNIARLSKKIKVDRSKVHRIINRLLDNGMLQKDNDKYIVTDAGKIARL